MNTEKPLGPIVESFEQYLSRLDCLCSSEVAALLESPLAYKLYRERGAEDKEPAHYTLGRAVHCAVGEPEQFEYRYAVLNEEHRPETDKTMASNKNKEWKSNMLAKGKAAGIEYLSPSIWNEVEQRKISVSRNPEAARVMSECDMFETSYYAEITHGERKYRVRCRPDMMGPKHYVSIKTTKAVTPELFYKEAATYDYQLKEAFYWLVLNATRRAMGMPELENGFIVAIGETETFVYELNPANLRGENKLSAFINDGIHLVDIALTRFDEYMKTGIAAGSEINFGGQMIIPMQTPSWKQFKIEQLIQTHNERNATTTEPAATTTGTAEGSNA